MQSQIERRVRHTPTMAEAKRERIRAAILSDDEGWEGARRALAQIRAGQPVRDLDGNLVEWPGDLPLP